MLDVVKHHGDDPTRDHSGWVVLDELETRLTNEISGGWISCREPWSSTAEPLEPQALSGYT